MDIVSPQEFRNKHCAEKYALPFTAFDLGGDYTPARWQLILPCRLSFLSFLLFFPPLSQESPHLQQ
jgi:hypothetical protein